jgi:serine/threonine protein kinase
LAELALKGTKSALSLGQKVGGTGSAGGLRRDQDSAT